MSDRPARITDGFEDQELAALEGLLRDRSFGPQDEIFTEDQPAVGLLLLKTGSVSIKKRDMQGSTQTLTVIQAPAVLGELELVAGTASNATVIANDEVAARVLPVPAFEALVEDRSVVATKLLRNVARALAQKLISTNELCVDLMPWN